jgi:iron complex outermembrane recepter protein
VETGVNRDRDSGGRLSALWKPADSFSLKLSALYQHQTGDGVSEVNLPTTGYPITNNLGDLQQSYVRGCCSYERTLETYSAIIKAKIGSVDLTSVTGYNVNRYSTGLDSSWSTLGLAQTFYPSATGVVEYTTSETSKFSQELRADIPIGQSVDWMVAAFYTHENTPFYLSLYGADHDTGDLNIAPGGGPGYLYGVSAPNKYTEYAAFTDLTVHFGERFSVQLGGRESHIDQVSPAGYFAGPVFGGTVPFAEAEGSSNVFTYLFSPQYRFSPDLMLYARIASGYRPGATNSFNADPLIPRASNPDKTQNYEIGVKGDALSHALTFDASVYYINWQDIQIELGDINPGPYYGIAYTTNGGRAKSEGVELSVEARPWTGMAITAWAAYSNPVLIDSLPPASQVYGPAGTRLPYGTRWSGSLSLNQTFPITDRVEGFVGGQVSYVGDRTGTFVPFSETAPRAYYGPYGKTDLHGGVTFDKLTANLYANNVFNRRGLLGGGNGTYPPYAYYYLQPRTVGLSLTLNF